MASSCKFLLSRNAFTAFAVVAVSILVFTSFHPGDSNVTSSAAQQSEFTDGADAMVAMQGAIEMCSSNSKSATCRGTTVTGITDTIVAMQSKLNLELGKEDEEDADSDMIVASQSTVHFDQGDENKDDQGAADGQEGESHPMNAVKVHAENLRSGPQEEKEEAVDSHANGPSSLFEEAETEVDADDHLDDDDDDDELPSANAALSSVTENRSSDNESVSVGLNTAAEEKAKVADAAAPSAEASSSADFAVNKNKTFSTGGTVEHDKSNTLSPNASGQGVMMQEEHRAKTFTESIRHMVDVSLKTLSPGGNPSLAMGLMVLLLMCTCLGGVTLAYPNMMQFADNSQTIPDQRPTLGTEQRQAMMERWPPASAGSILAPWPGQGNSRPSTRPSLPLSGPLGGYSLSKAGSQASLAAVSMSRSRPASQLVVPQPGSQVSMSLTAGLIAQGAPSGIKMTGQSPRASQSADPSTDPRAGFRAQEQNPEQKEEEVPPDVLPPPLCPMLVMPTCEARFGVPMFELAEVNGDGEVTIVGISGAPLLRAGVRKIGHLRTLEIGINEPGSAPRATITPSMMELAGSAPRGDGAKALEIRGMRGAFYGTLEMSARADGGTCCVMKDGKTVLKVDGNADNLKLSIKSGNGTRLASVCCTSEVFGDVDHIEVCVKKGVDAVLVLAVVLAVLLLSPYLTAPTPRTSQ